MAPHFSDDQIPRLEALAGAWSDAQDAELAGLLCSRGCDNDSNFKERYDLTMDIVKTEGGTFTSWMLLEDAGLN